MKGNDDCLQQKSQIIFIYKAFYEKKAKKEKKTRETQTQFIFSVCDNSSNHATQFSSILENSFTLYADANTFLFSVSVKFSDEENIPMKQISVTAGYNLTLTCPGVNEQSLISTLVWKKSQQILLKFTNGLPMGQSQRVSIFVIYLKVYVF